MGQEKEASKISSSTQTQLRHPQPPSHNHNHTQVQSDSGSAAEIISNSRKREQDQVEEAARDDELELELQAAPSPINNILKADESVESTSADHGYSVDTENSSYSEGSPVRLNKRRKTSSSSAYQHQPTIAISTPSSTSTTTSTSQSDLTMSVSPQHNPISPPTPAPSPQPELHSLLPSIAAANASSSHASTSRLGPSPLSTSTTFNHTSEPPGLDLISQLLSSLPLGQSQEKDVAILLALLGRVYPDLTSPKLKATFLSSLVSLCTLSDLTQLSSLINPRLKLDFFTSLPIEVSLLVLSFIDEPKTLARAMQVSSRWKSLVEDEGTWKGMCEKHRFEMEEEDEEDDEDEEEDDEDDSQAVQIASTSNLGLQENQIQSLNAIGNSGQGSPPPSTLPIPTSFSTSTSTPTPTPSTFASTSSSSIPTPSHQTFPIPSTFSSSSNPTSTSSNSNSYSLNQRSSNELPLLSKSSQDSLMDSIQLRFSGKGLNPFNASEDLNWFYQKLENQNQNQVGSSIDSIPMGVEEIEKMNLIELILREECQERYGGLRADNDERSFLSTKGKSNRKFGGGVDDDSMEIDTDSQSKFKSQPQPRFSTKGDQFVQVQGLGKGRPSPSPSPFKRNQSLRNDSRGNLTGGNRSVSFDNGSVGGRFNSPGFPNNQKRTFSYRTHFKLAYLTGKSSTFL